MSGGELEAIRELKEVAKVYGWSEDNPTYRKRLKAIQVKHTEIMVQESKPKRAAKKGAGGRDKRRAFVWVDVGKATTWALATAELAKLWKVKPTDIKPDRPSRGETTIKKARFSFRRFKNSSDDAAKPARIVEMSAALYVVQLGNEKVEEDDEGDGEDGDTDADGELPEGEGEGEDGEEDIDVLSAAAGGKGKAKPAAKKKQPPKPTEMPPEMQPPRGAASASVVRGKAASRKTTPEEVVQPAPAVGKRQRGAAK